MTYLSRNVRLHRIAQQQVFESRCRNVQQSTAGWGNKSLKGIMRKARSDT